MIIPSIIATSQEELDERYAKVKNFGDTIHLDVMDGEFVESHSLDFSFNFLKEKYVEVHLMVTDVMSFVERLLGVGDLFIIPVESETVREIISFLHTEGKQVGLAINPDTKPEKLEPYLDKIEQVTVMTVYPGAYGAEFVPKALETVKWIVAQKRDTLIECDGHMTAKTIPQAKAAGADKFIAGSVLQKSEYPTDMYQLLQQAQDN